MAVTFNSTLDFLYKVGGAGFYPASYTITCWVKVHSAAGTNRQYISSNGSAADAMLSASGLGAGNDRPALVDQNNQSNNIVGSPITFEAWNFLAITINGTAGNLYQGTEFASVANYSGTVSGQGSGSTFYFAPEAIGRGGTTQYDLSQVRFWNAVLTGAEIEAERLSATPVVTANLTADWRFATAATKTNDSSGNGNGLTAGDVGPWETASEPSPQPPIVGTGASQQTNATSSGSATQSITGTSSVVQTNAVSSGTGVIMALRKFTYINGTDGFVQEQATTDELSLGKATFLGVGGIAIDAGSQRITSVLNPTSAQDAATKNYVDGLVNGLDWKASVRAIATSNITLSGAQTIDTVSVIAGDRVLVAGQTLPAYNGIYVAAAGAWARASDADSSAEVTPNLAVFVEEGTYQDTGWTLTTDAPITLDSTALTFTQFTGIGVLIGGAGILKTGNTIDVELDTGADAQGAGSGGGSSGLEFDASGVGGKLRAAVHATAGLERTASGLGAKLNGTTLQSAAGGLSVKGLPSLFEIATVATSANVTAANLGTLTAGTTSAADTLHTHEGTLQSFTAGGTISKGEGVYISANNTVSQGLNTTTAGSRIIGVANAAVVVTESTPVKVNGTVTSVLSGATAGNPYYLGPTGAPVLFASLTSGARIIRLGFALNASDLLVRLQDFGQLA